MKKQVIGLAISAMCLSSIAGCGGTNTAGSATTAAGVDISTEAASVAETEKDETEGSTTEAETVAANYEVPFTMADIDWHVEEKIIDGERKYGLYYTNNTSYNIIEIDIDYTRKSDATDDQMLAAFSELRRENDGYYDDDEILDFGLRAINRGFAVPGATVEPESIYPSKGYSDITSEDQYSLFEPDIATIAYVDGDKVYPAYYDFKNDEMSCDIYSVIDKYTWTDSAFASNLPKPDLYIVRLGNDEDDKVDFDAYGVTQSDFEAYKDACVQKGFTVDVNEYENHYEAKNADGLNLELIYRPYMSCLECWLTTEE